MIRLLGPAMALLAGLSGVAHADPAERGLYLSGAVGLNYPGDMDARPNGFAVHADIEFEPSAAFAGAIGYRVHRTFRVEGEVGYRSNSVSAVDATGVGRIRSGGHVQSWTFMANGYVEFTCGKIQPYLGVGLGAVSIHDDGLTTNNTTNKVDETAFAYQFLIGLGYDLWDSLILDLDYRYLQFGDVEITNAVSGTQDLKLDPSHIFMIGLRYMF